MELTLYWVLGVLTTIWTLNPSQMYILQKCFIIHLILAKRPRSHGTSVFFYQREYEGVCGMIEMTQSLRVWMHMGFGWWHISGSLLGKYEQMKTVISQMNRHRKERSTRYCLSSLRYWLGYAIVIFVARSLWSLYQKQKPETLQNYFCQNSIKR